MDVQSNDTHQSQTLDNLYADIAVRGHGIILSSSHVHSIVGLPFNDNQLLFGYHDPFSVGSGKQIYSPGDTIVTVQL